MERRLDTPEQTFRGLFLSLGFTLRDRGAHGFDAEGAEGRRFHVWAPKLQQGADLARLRQDVLAEVQAAPEGGVRLVLLPSLPAMGAAFQSEITQAGALLRTYGQFLDDEFKTDANLVLTGQRDAEARRRARTVLEQRGEQARGKLSLLPPALRARLDARGAIDPMAVEGPLRLDQPYRRIAGPDLGPGHDLLNDLVGFLDPEDPADATPPSVVSGPNVDVILVVGNAGVGKSEFFDALYAYANRRFLDVKMRQGVAARAIRFTPDEIVDAPSYSAARLFDAIAETPEAGLGQRALLDWRLTEGLLFLMFDGLDEFFADQEDFFAELEARYLGGASRARILICLRDSLLSTSDAVRVLTERLGAHPHCRLTILQVERWRASKEQLRAFAWARIEERTPPEGAADTPAVRAFVEFMTAREGWRELAGLPFFLQAAAELLRDGAGDEIKDRYDLLDRLIDRICAREWAKLDRSAPHLTQAEAAFARTPDVVRRLSFSVALAFKGAAWVRLLETMFGAAPATPQQIEDVDKFFDALSAFEGRADFTRLLEDLAHLKRRGGDGVALTRERLLELYENSLPIDRSSSARKRGEIVLRQFALFEADGSDAVDFNHVIIADHLAGRAAARRLAADASSKAVAQAIGVAPVDETDAFWGAIERGLSAAPAALQAVRAARTATVA